MTTEEFKLEFKTYYNNISSNQAPGVNDYELSQFLTLALEQIVEEVYTGRYVNPGFEKTEHLRKSIDALLRERQITVEPDLNNAFPTSAFDGTIDIAPTLEDPHPDEVMFVVMEWAQIEKDSKLKTVEVIPIKYDDFLRTYKNPFRGVSKKRVLRLDTGNGEVKLHALKGYDIQDYRIEFIKKPKPIIIGSNEFAAYTINGFPADANCECELDSSIHRDILLRAVQLAKAAWQSK